MNLCFSTSGLSIPVPRWKGFAVKSNETLSNKIRVRNAKPSWIWRTKVHDAEILLFILFRNGISPNKAKERKRTHSICISDPLRYFLWLRVPASRLTATTPQQTPSFRGHGKVHLPRYAICISTRAIRQRKPNGIDGIDRSWEPQVPARASRCTDGTLGLPHKAVGTVRETTSHVAASFGSISYAAPFTTRSAPTSSPQHQQPVEILLRYRSPNQTPESNQPQVIFRHSLTFFKSIYPKIYSYRAS